MVQADLTDVEKSSIATKLLNFGVGSDLVTHYVEHTSEYSRLNEVDIYGTPPTTTTTLSLFLFFYFSLFNIFFNMILTF